MKLAHRMAQTAAVLAAGTLATACTPGVTPSPEVTPHSSAANSATPTPSFVTGENALRLVNEDRKAKFQLLVTAEEQIADGAAIVINASDKPLVLKTVELVYQDAPAVNPVLGVNVVPLSGSNSDRPLGITRDYPPAGVQLVAITDAELEPTHVKGDRYQIMVGLRVTKGTISITGLRVTFVLDGVTYSRVIPHHVQLCTGRPAGSTTC